MLHISLLHLVTCSLQLFDGFPHIHGLPHDHRIRHEIQTGRLIELIIGMTCADRRFIGHEQIPPQCVQGFALVQLLTDLATVFLTAQIPQDKVRFNEPTICL
jgi:hypothetical protein